MTAFSMMYPLTPDLGTSAERHMEGTLLSAAVVVTVVFAWEGSANDRRNSTASVKARSLPTVRG